MRSSCAARAVLEPFPLDRVDLKVLGDKPATTPSSGPEARAGDADRSLYCTVTAARRYVKRGQL
jgi:hypothetical protein